MVFDFAKERAICPRFRPEPGYVVGEDNPARELQPASVYLLFCVDNFIHCFCFFLFIFFQFLKTSMFSMVGLHRIIHVAVFGMFENLLCTLWINSSTASEQYFFHFGQVGFPIVRRTLFRHDT